MVVDAGSCRGSTRRKDVQDPLTLTRKIGHPELIFNENIYWNQEFSIANSEARWGFSCSARGDDCYVCQRFSYLQIFFRRGKAHLDFQVVQDQELKDILMETYNLDSNEALRGGAPIFLSSANNWVLTRFVDVRIFA